MTIITILGIPEGFILGSDTQTTLSKIIKKNDKKKEIIPVNFFRNAQKIFNLSTENSNLKIAVSQFGIANPGGRPLSNHIFNLREILEKESENMNMLENYADLIIDYFKKYDKSRLKGLGFFLTGFSLREKRYIPEVYQILFLLDKTEKLIIQKKQIRKILKNEDCGFSWAGEGSWIISKLLKISDPSKSLPKSDISFQFFSLKDGVEFTEYIINTVIGFEKFQARFPQCGGNVKIAILTPREFKFYWAGEDILI
ncbi:MAG: hypothetical protein ACQERB_05695 [Promethearchaeati archaeon]